ncbi:HNH endonuclease domain-containing protein [Hydrogenimonas sp.]
MLNMETFRLINHVIEYDATSSTYKFVLLKNVIDVCQKYDHLIRMERDRVRAPLGLVVEGWMFDYLPFVFQGIRQQQARGNVLNRKLEELYERLFESFHLTRESHSWKDALITVRTAYRNRELEAEQSKILSAIAKESAVTITHMPMRYAGPEPYGLFRPAKMSFPLPRKVPFDREVSIASFDMFEMDRDVYEIFRFLGQSLQGYSTIARRWKEKTCLANPNLCLTESIVEEMIYGDVEDVRDTAMARKLLPGNVECVWSGKRLSSKRVHIDHVLPYSVWHNNDLWNLMPTSPEINNRKRDKIPTPAFIEERKEYIEKYWELYLSRARELFRYQAKNSLGSGDGNFEALIGSLKRKARYLIEDRGLPPFAL